MTIISKVEETLSKLFTAERKLQEEKAEAEKKEVTARQVRIILVIACAMRLMMILFVMTIALMWVLLLLSKCP